MPAKATALSQSLAGTELRATVVARDGASLTDHLRSGDLRKALQERQFDVVVLQDIGGFPLCDASFPGCATAQAALRESASIAKATGARVLMYGTWQSKPALQPAMSKSSMKMAEDADVQLVDVGAAMWKWSDSARPALLPDGHPSEIGSWIVATAIVSALSKGKAPRVRSIEHCFAPERCVALSAEDVSVVLAVAWRSQPNTQDVALNLAAPRAERTRCTSPVIKNCPRDAHGFASSSGVDERSRMLLDIDGPVVIYGDRPRIRSPEQIIRDALSGPRTAPGQTRTYETIDGRRCTESSAFGFVQCSRPNNGAPLRGVIDIN